LELSREEDLRATPSGQVLHDLGGGSAWDLKLGRAKALAPAREAIARMPRDAGAAEVRPVSGGRARLPAPGARVTRVEGAAGARGGPRRAGAGGGMAEAGRGGEWSRPAPLLGPEPRADTRPAVLMADSRGKAREAGAGPSGKATPGPPGKETPGPPGKAGP